MFSAGASQGAGAAAPSNRFGDAAPSSSPPSAAPTAHARGGSAAAGEAAAASAAAAAAARKRSCAHVETRQLPACSRVMREPPHPRLRAGALRGRPAARARGPAELAPGLPNCLRVTLNARAIADCRQQPRTPHPAPRTPHPAPRTPHTPTHPPTNRTYTHRTLTHLEKESVTLEATDLGRDNGSRRPNGGGVARGDCSRDARRRRSSGRIVASHRI